MILLTILLSFAFTSEDPKKDLDLIEPIAKERADNYYLPKNSFTDTSGVASWFVKEKGFVADSKKKRPSRKISSKKGKIKKNRATSKLKKKRLPSNKRKKIPRAKRK